MSDGQFYGADQATIHHLHFGDLARRAGELLLQLLREQGHHAGTVVDLGCGSGILARLLTDAGYQVLGVDISADMIRLAAEHAPKATFRQGSVLDAELPAAVAVAAIGEVLNYAADPRAGLEQLERLAWRVRDALEPGGVLVFDIATPGRAGPEGMRQRFHDREQWSLYVRSEERAGQRVLDRFITIFSRTESGLYRRGDEHHVLRLYDPGEVVELLDRAGFDAETLDDYPSPAPGARPLEGWKVIVACPRRQGGGGA